MLLDELNATVVLYGYTARQTLEGRSNEETDVN